MNNLQDIQIHKIISSKRKTISLEVTLEGKVILRAPSRISDTHINEFISKHKNWIIRKLEPIHSHAKTADTEHLYFLGEKYDIRLNNEMLEPFRFADAFYFSERYYRFRNEILKSWLKNQAQNYILPKFSELAEKYGVVFNKISISSASRRWGSCNSKRNVNFSFRLIMAEARAVDYVIIHELAHLKQMNHSANFWNEVKKMMPDYKENEKYLRLNAHKFRLPPLV